MSSTEMVKCGLSIWGFTKQHDGTSIMKDILLVPLWLLTVAALIGAQSLDYQTYKAGRAYLSEEASDSRTLHRLSCRRKSRVSFRATRQGR